MFGTDGYLGDREGLAVYASPGGGGYIVSSDQVPGASRVHLYARAGEPGAPHVHRRLAIVETGADDTDGLEAVPAPVGAFTGGLLVIMNSGPRNFLFFDWNDVRGVVRLACGQEPASGDSGTGAAASRVAPPGAGTLALRVLRRASQSCNCSM